MYVCFPETLRATGGLEIPFSFLAPCSVTLPASAHPRPLPFPLRRHRHMLVARAPPPTVCVQASGCVSGFSFVDSSHMLGAFEPVLIGPRGKHHKPKTANIDLRAYGGMRQPCMHGEMAAAPTLQFPAAGIGSNRISAAPRRGGEVNICHASLGSHCPVQPCNTSFGL